jgi:hypothetical protein
MSYILTSVNSTPYCTRPESCSSNVNITKNYQSVVISHDTRLSYEDDANFRACRRKFRSDARYLMLAYLVQFRAEYDVIKLFLKSSVKLNIHVFTSLLRLKNKLTTIN